MPVERDAGVQCSNRFFGEDAAAWWLPISVILEKLHHGRFVDVVVLDQKLASSLVSMSFLAYAAVT